MDKNDLMSGLWGDGFCFWNHSQVGGIETRPGCCQLRIESVVHNPVTKANDFVFTLVRRDISPGP